jgi:hypothetical protein
MSMNLNRYRDTLWQPINWLPTPAVDPAISLLVYTTSWPFEVSLPEMLGETSMTIELGIGWADWADCVASFGIVASLLQQVNECESVVQVVLLEEVILHAVYGVGALVVIPKIKYMHLEGASGYRARPIKRNLAARRCGPMEWHKVPGYMFVAAPAGKACVLVMTSKHVIVEFVSS